jgi:hypothetical protein
MSDRHNRLTRRSYSWARAIIAAAILPPGAPAFATVNAYASEAAAGFHTDVMSERRCKWTLKNERCDWVKRDHKRTTSR